MATDACSAPAAGVAPPAGEAGVGDSALGLPVLVGVPTPLPLSFLWCPMPSFDASLRVLALSLDMPEGDAGRTGGCPAACPPGAGCSRGRMGRRGSQRVRAACYVCQISAFGELRLLRMGDGFLNSCFRCRCRRGVTASFQALDPRQVPLASIISFTSVGVGRRYLITWTFDAQQSNCKPVASPSYAQEVHEAEVEAICDAAVCYASKAAIAQRAEAH